MVGRSINWAYNIGDCVSSFNRNLSVIDRELREYKYKKYNKEYVTNYQYYKYRCNNCGFINWISLSNLNKGVKCSCCSNHVVVKGINDVATLRPELLKYFVNINDAYTHTVMSGKKVKCKCPTCGTEKYILISNLSAHGFSCDKCSDGISYPEKFVANVLSQLKINFIKQYEINGFKYKYDFYLPQYKTIIETHGEQHYCNTFYKTTLEKVQENDLKKENIALQNNIDNYVILDCRKSEVNHIKNSIYNSDFFSDNFNLSSIDWELCHKESLENKLIEICQYWNEHSDTICVSDVMKIFSMPRTTVRKYLHIGTEIGLCYFDKSIESKKSGKKRMRENNWISRKVKQFTKDGVFVNEWLCIKDVERELGFFGSNITKCCRGNIKTAYGFVWRYSDE